MPSFTRQIDVKALERLESGIDGLDAITHGGFVAGAAYLIQGRPGCVAWLWCIYQDILRLRGKLDVGLCKLEYLPCWAYIVHEE